jgi:hypothetical protein
MKYEKVTQRWTENCAETHAEIREKNSPISPLRISVSPP